MRAAVVLGENLDILVAVTAFELVLDPEVREVNAVIEVRQVVLTGPFFDLHLNLMELVADGPLYGVGKRLIGADRLNVVAVTEV